jgi:hypothetical protein
MADPPVALSYPPDIEYLQNYVLSLTERVNTLAPSPLEVKVGDYLLFQDADGSLKIKAPDNTVTPLIIKA